MYICLEKLISASGQLYHIEDSVSLRNDTVLDMSLMRLDEA